MHVGAVYDKELTPAVALVKITFGMLHPDDQDEDNHWEPGNCPGCGKAHWPYGAEPKNGEAQGDSEP